MIQRFLSSIRKHDGLAVALVLIVTYFSISLAFDYLQNLEKTMFLLPDSQSYRAVGDWLFGIEDTNATLIRPFFYPLMLNLFRSLAGTYGIWAFQLMLWISAGVLLYQSTKKASKNMALSIGGVLIFASNLTLLLLTLHALTEGVVTFLITILILLIVNKQELGTRYWLLVIFVVSLLTVTKPVFSLLLFAVLAYRIPYFILGARKGPYRFRWLAYLVLALCPVLIQLTIMEAKHDMFTISQIGSKTAKNYYFPRVYGEENNITVEQAREQTSSFDQEEMLEYLLTHFEASLVTYIKSLGDNLVVGSTLVDHPDTHTHLFNYMIIVTRAYFFLHVLMMLPTVIVLVTLFRQRNWAELEIAISLIIPLGLIILTSGITFYQRDRIVIPSLPLWIVLYSLVLSKLWHLIRERRLTMGGSLLLFR